MMNVFVLHLIWQSNGSRSAPIRSVRPPAHALTATASDVPGLYSPSMYIHLILPTHVEEQNVATVLFFPLVTMFLKIIIALLNS
jgi:hypothetical protein